ncbi:hypothetical protein [Pedobacter sp. ASV28]|uniref:hypothetical protein n=1 Tax=Pedobacter sp. ASV28 TaxID=2795123 RepID=UPI0018EAF1E1|nr:hypothetical protein [Pedobacter sp. ASV28]
MIAYKKSIIILSTFVIFLNVLSSCKKDKKETENTIIGSWELSSITFTGQNQIVLPIDSFKNFIACNITFNTDSSFQRTEQFGKILLGLNNDLSTSIVEQFVTKYKNARYLIWEGDQKDFPTTSSKFSISNNTLFFIEEFKDNYTISERKYFNAFQLKNNGTQLEIRREDLIILNTQNNSPVTSQLIFTYKRK